MEKLTSGAAASSARRPVSISSPIAIPKKPPRSNVSNVPEERQPMIQCNSVVFFSNEINQLSNISFTSLVGIIAKLVILHVCCRSNVLPECMKKKKSVVFLLLFYLEFRLTRNHRHHFVGILMMVTKKNGKLENLNLMVFFSGGNSSLPTLPSTGEQLAHTAARDRISVKNRRRQPANQKVVRQESQRRRDLYF